MDGEHRKGTRLAPAVVGVVACSAGLLAGSCAFENGPARRLPVTLQSPPAAV
jgi:hypothetical protein